MVKTQGVTDVASIPSIDEIRSITANAVAKKQDAAKMNYPKLLEKIRSAAQMGESSCRLSLNQMNEYDKALLEKEGYRVILANIEHNDYKRKYLDNVLNPSKEWKINW